MNFSCLRTLKESLDAREVVSQDGPHIAYLTSAGSNSIPGHRLAFPASVVLVQSLWYGSVFQHPGVSVILQ